MYLYTINYIDQHTLRIVGVIEDPDCDDMLSWDIGLFMFNSFNSLILLYSVISMIFELIGTQFNEDNSKISDENNYWDKNKLIIK